MSYCNMPGAVKTQSKTGLKILLAAFAIGFGFRLFLGAPFAYSAIGFDPMGQYVLELYSHPAIVQLLPRGVVYYLISLGMNNILNNPLLTIKILDALISGIFLASVTYFAYRTIESKYVLPLSIAALLSYQFLSLSWGFEKEMLAFSIFLIIATFRKFSVRNFIIIFPLAILSGLTDPTVVPLEFFWFLFIGIKERGFLIMDLLLAILTITDLSLFTYIGDNGMAFGIHIIRDMYNPAKLYAVGVLALIMFAPFVIMIPDFVKAVKSGVHFMEKPLFLILMSALAATFVASYFAPRYIMLSSVLLFLAIPLESRKSRKRAFAMVMIVIVIAASFVMFPVSDPSPVFGSHLNVASGEIEIVPGSFAQSTVPIRDAPTLVKLYSDISYMPNSSKAIVVTMLYTAAYAYEAGIPPDHVVDTYTDYNLMLKDAAGLSAKGDTVYAVWWTNYGWYGVSHLPSDFKLVKSDNGFGLYVYR